MAEKPIRAAVFKTVPLAEKAVQKLVEAGFTNQQISVLCSDETKESHFKQFEHEQPAGSHTAEAAASGGAIGGLLGGLVSAGVATAAGLSVLVAGPSFLIGGAVAGGLIGAMSTRGLEGALADFYDQAVTRGHIVVAVEDHGDGKRANLKKAEHIFEDIGAEPIPLVEG